MKLLFDEGLCVEDDNCVGLYPGGCETGVGMKVMKITGETELVEGLEADEVCPTEAIIQAWRRLRY